MTSQHVTKWREAHQGIAVEENALETIAPFASLHANDFAVYMESKGHGAEVVDFVRAISRELVWTYDNWQKAQRDAKPELLLADLINNARGDPAYEFTQKFLRDYAKANNINLDPAIGERPAWDVIIPQGRDTP